MQSLFIGDNQWIKIDRKFVDGGTPAKMGVSGRTVVELSPEIPAKPAILMARGGFYYENREPVTNPEDVSDLPDGKSKSGQPIGPNYRAMAEDWIKKMKGKAPKLPLTRGKQTEDGHPVPPDRGRSLRDREPLEIDSEERAERVLVGSGLQDLEREESRPRRQL